MIYKSVSIDEVIGRVIRNTRLQDTAYIADITVWIPEAMRMMGAIQALVPDFKDLQVKFHKAHMPCLEFIEAVEWRCHRLRHGNSIKDARTPQPRSYNTGGTDVYTSVVYKQPVPDGNYNYVSDLVKLNECPETYHEYYQTELDRIITSFECDNIRVYFQRVPLDARGLPMIPDNENFKQALYWYVRDMMVGSGYEDKVFKEKELFEKWEFYAGRAMAEITFPSPDEMETRIATLSRFIPPENYWENYFKVSHKEPEIRPMNSYYNNFLDI